ncbi:MAG: 4-alpha-glucanotransferase [Clostridia bacterium]|nr:4-alpha-glucanotransferase [Clostridia bacterium]
MRKAGILLPITAIPSSYGIGGFSKEAYEFVDFLKEAGQSYWQILPMGPTGFGDSPYQAFSSFAGNPYYISLDSLIEEGLLTKDECDNADYGGDERNIDYKKIYNSRLRLLHKAYKRADTKQDSAFHDFVGENVKWLEDYALFMALKDYFGGRPWYEWDLEIKMCQAKATEKYNEILHGEVTFWKYLQYKFYSQWYELKKYANDRGIKIIGDIPIYVAYDSADVWSNSALFQLDVDKTPICVAGCPPDGFSKKGQLWGNPLYKWEIHKETGYLWWIYRIEHCFKLYDTLRIDHFRGFDEYYSIEYGSKEATKGKWESGPKKALFDAVFDRLGKKEIIAEDLGFITESVKDLLEECEFPGMRVFQFGFDKRDTGAKNNYLPHNYIENCVAYTGTHDNPTIVSWFFEITEEERKDVRAYLCDNYTPNSEVHLPIIGTVMRSKAKLCIIPIQDYLGYDSRSRINKPATVGSNWTWRLTKTDLNKKLANQIYEITRLCGRVDDSSNDI